MNAQTQAPIEWLFKKNCSFTPRQVGLFYLAQSALSLLVAGFFILQGIWIVLAFTCIELIVLAIALLIYARHATDYERITLRPGELMIEISQAGQLIQYVWHISWVKLDRILSPNKLISLAYQGKSIEVGRYMHVSVRQDFLLEFAQELRRNS